MEFSKYNLVYFLMVLVFALPLIIITNDLWDGSMVAYGFRTDDLSGIKGMYFESGWHLQYYLYQIVYTISSYIGIKEALILKIITILSVIGISKEVKSLSLNTFKMSEKMAYISGYLVLLFPAWFVLVSNVLFFHVLCIYSLLLGYRLVMTRRQYVVGFFLVLFSLQLESNYMLIIGLIFSDYFLEKNKLSRIHFSHLILSIIALIFLFILNQNIFGAYGITDGYNELQFNTSSIKPMIGHTINFIIFILVLITIPLLIFLWNFKDAFRKDDGIKYLMLFLLIICAIFPYAALGKSPGLFNFYDWIYRQAFLLSVPIPILIAFLYSRIEASNASKASTKPIFFKIALTFILFFSFLYTGFSYKLSSDFYQKAIVHSLKKINQPPAGIIGLNLESDQISDYLTQIRWYEYNSLFHKAFGEANWMISSIKRNELNEIFLLTHTQKQVLSNKSLRIRYVAKYAHPNCKTVIEINQKKDLDFLDILTDRHEDVFDFAIIQSEGLSCSIRASIFH
jgi:hypothetical protein